MDVSDPGGSVEDVACVVKEVVSLLTLSKGFGAILETSMWGLQSTFFFSLELPFLKPFLPLKKVEKDKGTDWARFTTLHICGRSFDSEWSSEFLDFHQVDIYLLKVNNRNTKIGCKICSKLTTKTPKQRQWVLYCLFGNEWLSSETVCYMLAKLILLP